MCLLNSVVHPKTARPERFLPILPKIQAQARFAFRQLRCELREELIAETVAIAFRSWMLLVRRGKAARAFATPLGRYAIRRVQEGRNLAGRASRSDVLSPQAQRRYGIQVQRLVHSDWQGEPCHELLLEDRTAGPAETAAARIDLEAWLSQLSPRNRRIALALARGESTGEAARQFQLSPGRISQLREVLRIHWERVHGQGPMAECAA
jgi:hypothetical protein